MNSNNIYIQNILNKCVVNEFTQQYIELMEFRLNSDEILGYSEKHHILPRCICSKFEIVDKLNIVKLSAKEHFHAHMLLTKMFSDKKITLQMMNAFNKFYQQNSNQNRNINKEEYETLRINASNRMKLMWQDEEFRNKQTIRLGLLWQDEEFRTKMRKANCDKWDEALRRKCSERCKITNIANNFGTKKITVEDTNLILNYANNGWLINHIIKEFTHLTRKMVIRVIHNNRKSNEYPNIRRFYGIKSVLNPNELKSKYDFIVSQLDVSEDRKINNKTRRFYRNILKSRYFIMLHELKLI